MSTPIPLLADEQLDLCERLLEEYYHRCRRDPARRAEIIRNVRVILGVDAPPTRFREEAAALSNRCHAARNMVVVVGRGLVTGQPVTYNGGPARITAINADYSVDVDLELNDPPGKRRKRRGISPLSCHPIT
jgi:hypothetical protein